MPSLTLAEAGNLQQNPLIQGVIESIVTVNQIFNSLPFDQIVGNALLYTREDAIGGVTPIGTGGGSNVIPAGAKTPATFTPVTTPLKALIGDALVDHFVESTMGTQNDQRAVQVASKAKALGREYQRQMIIGNSTTDPLEFDGIEVLTPAAQTISAASAQLSFEYLDELMSLVKAKDGAVDFIMCPDIGLRKYRSILRALGGAGIGEVKTMPDGTQLDMYRGVPMFRNDWIVVEDGGGAIRNTDFYAGTFDDGSRKVGIAGLTSAVQSGIFTSYVGEAELTNDTITRLRFYASMAVFSQLGIAKLDTVRVAG